MEKKVKELNQIISSNAWFDFEVYDSSFLNFIIYGSSDFSLGHQMEISFKNVYHVTINSNWKTETSKSVFKIIVGKEKYNFIDHYGFEENLILFKIENEDYAPFYVVAESIDFQYKKVLYYEKDNLDDNEEIADWVLKK